IPPTPEPTPRNTKLSANTAPRKMNTGFWVRRIFSNSMWLALDHLGAHRARGFGIGRFAASPVAYPAVDHREQHAIRRPTVDRGGDGVVPWQVRRPGQVEHGQVGPFALGQRSDPLSQADRGRAVQR